jgi:hypothetical protein
LSLVWSRATRPRVEVGYWRQFGYGMCGLALTFSEYGPCHVRIYFKELSLMGATGTRVARGHTVCLWGM